MKEEILEKFNAYDLVVGVDEVGRGPIAGPVTVCAFALRGKYHNEIHERLDGITDSKKLSEKRRDFYADIIRQLKIEGKIELSISSVSAKKIDESGIVPSIFSALNRSVTNVTVGYKKSYIYLDGSLHAKSEFNQEVIIKGDSKNWLIGAASVAAKVARDNQMKKLSEKYPNYGFEQHKGYGTKKHYENIEENGLCEIHRKSWIK